MEGLRQFEDMLDNYRIGTLIEMAIVLLIGLILIKILLVITRRMLTRSMIDSVLYTFILNCVKVACLIILVITVLSVAGIPTSTFITVLAAAGAAIALAVQDSLSNFAGGLLILLSKPFVRGDLIESGGITGKVQEINLLYSRLVTYDNKIICMPNSALANNTLINYFGADLRRIDVKVGVSYQSDIDKVKSVIMQVIENTEILLSEPKPMVGVSDLADSAVIYDAFTWCRSDDYFQARYSLYENLKKAFDREGIEIPYPQIVLHADGMTEGNAAKETDSTIYDDIQN